MWNSSEYGGFGGNMAQQQSGGFLNTTSTASPGAASTEKKKGGRMTNVVPCTITQILNMPESDENLTIGSLSAHMVTLIGLIRTIDVQTSKITFFIDDLSGPGIEAQIWIGENEELEKRMHGIRENMYVRITGAVRIMKGKRHIIAFKVNPISEVNEITAHLLEVVHTSMAIAVMDKQQPLQPLGSFSASATGFMGASKDTTQNFGVVEGNTMGGLSKPQQIVFQVISTCMNEAGISTTEIMSKVKSLDRRTIKEAVEFLSNEGHIFSTIDEDHFKSTDAL